MDEGDADPCVGREGQSGAVEGVRAGGEEAVWPADLGEGVGEHPLHRRVLGTRRARGTRWERQVLAGMDDAVDGEVVGREKGGEGDAVARGDQSEGVAGANGVGGTAGRGGWLAGRRAAWDGEALSGMDDAVDGEV